MAIYKTFNDLVISMIEHLRLLQPELDTKPGTVSRDVFIDAPSQQLANLYSQLRAIAGLQSLFSASGSDLNRLGANYSVARAGGASATGVAVFTTNNLDIDTLIPSGSIITARNGVNYETLSPIVMKSDSANVYRATATRLRTELNLASITDEFAIEITVQSLTSGLSGNIGRYSITSHNISGISNITNLGSFSGGSNAESDDEYRTRILSIFAGSNTGTALGYETAIGVVSGVLDSEIVVFGDPLLIRDGTQVSTDSSGNLVVSDPGSGGKVDIYVLGEDLNDEIDSFIYSDQGGNDDPTSPSNDVILGQKGEDTTLNAAQRRVTLIAANDLPFQPVKNILTVSGSSSGSNFIEKFVDSNGRTRGNFELTKDDGDFGGSPFGFDKLHWVSNTIELEGEDITKGVFNGYDPLSFSDVSEIKSITQDFLITNESPIVDVSNRSSITLRHTPIRNVSRIANLTSGERYVIENQNPDGTEGSLNTTGKVTISGNTLPVGTDTLQADYTWVKSFDAEFDFDNLDNYNEVRIAQDSVDWGFGNLVKNEPASVTEDAYGNITVTVSHPIYRVISVNTFDTDTSTVLNNIVVATNDVTNIIDVIRVSDGADLFNTDARDGSLTGSVSILLPTDTIASDNDVVSLRLNATDVFDTTDYGIGSFDGSIISIPAGASNDGTSVLVSYIANVSVLIPENGLSDLPMVKNSNKFLFSDNVITGEQPTSNLLDSNSNFTNNLRRAGSNIRVEISSTPSGGSIIVSGTTVRKVEDALITITSGSGYEADLQSAILSDSGASSLSSNIRISKLVSFERVNVDNTGTVTSVDNTYDIINYTLKDSSYDLDAARTDVSLGNTDLLIPQTLNNIAAALDTGDIVRVTFYYIETSVSETLYYSRNGSQITDNVFIDISRISLGSGFTNVSGDIIGNISVHNFNQPEGNTTYGSSYNYTAPKEDERITVTFNTNSLMGLATNAIEGVRPITADVLVKEAIAKTISVSINIILLPEYSAQAQTVKQDAVDAVTSFLNSGSLGSTVDASDIVNTLYSVSGIDRVRIINFSEDGGGNTLSVSAEKNEYLNAGTITIEVEER